MAQEVVGRGRKYTKYRDPAWPTGKYAQLITLHDQHYRDAGGNWQAVEEVIESDGADGFADKAERMAHRARFGVGGNRRWYPRRNLDEYVDFGAPDYWDVNRWRNWLLTGLTKLANGYRWDTADYTVTVQVNWRRVELTYVLKNGTASPRIRFGVTLTGLTLQPDGSLVSQSDGLTVGRLDPVKAWDALGSYEAPNVPLTEAGVSGGYYLLTLDPAGHAYPITVDPNTTIQPDSASVDTSVGPGFPNDTTNYNNRDACYVANLANQHTLCKPDLSSVEGVDITLVQYTETWATDNWVDFGSHSVARILAANSAWTETACWNYATGTTRWAGDTGSDGGSDAGCSVSGTDFASPAMGSYTIGNVQKLAGSTVTISLDATQFETLVANNYGQIIYGSTAGLANIASSDHATASYRPKWYVEYTELPDYTVTVSGTLATSGTLTTVKFDKSGPNYPTVAANNSTGDEIDEPWVNPTYIYADDSNYAAITAATFDAPDPNNDISQQLVASGFGFAIDTDATIQGITVEVNRDCTAGGAVDYRVQLRDASGALAGNNKATADAWPASLATATYGGPTDAWGVSPTPAMVNDADFGLVVSCRATANNTDVHVDFVRITVHYTLPSGTTYPVSIAGTLATSGTLSKQPQKPFSGTLASSGTYARGLSLLRAFAGPLASAGVLAKQARKSWAGTLATAATLATSKIKTFSAGGTLATAGVLAKQAVRFWDGALGTAGGLAKQVRKPLSGTLASSGALGRTLSLFRSFAGPLATAGALATVKTRLLAVAGTLVATGSFQKRADRVVGGALATAGAISRLPRKVFAGTLASSGVVATIKTKLLAVAGTLATAGTFSRLPRKALSGTLASSGTLAKRSYKSLAGTLASSGTVATIKTKLLAVAGALATSGVLLSARTLRRAFAGPLDTSGALVKQARKSWAGTLASSGAIVTIKTKLVTLAGTLATSGLLAKRSYRTLSGTLASSGAFAKRSYKSLAGVLATAAAVAVEVVSGQKTVTVAGVLATSGALSKQVGRGLSGLLATTGAYARRLTLLRAFAGALVTGGALVRRLTISRAWAGALASSGTLGVVKVKVLAVAGVLATSGALRRMPIKRFQGTLATSGAVVRHFSRRVVALFRGVVARALGVQGRVSTSVEGSGETGDVSGGGEL